jgi:pyruvate formate lyase activating enzyme
MTKVADFVSDLKGFPSRYGHALGDGRIQCHLWPYVCKLHEGQRGLCFVRARTDDWVVLTTYGRSSGFCIDPIEKKRLNYFLPSAPVLSFETAGCNLTCKFCQNWDISKSREFDRLADKAMREDIAKVSAKYRSRWVAFTYNDPGIFLEYAPDRHSCTNPASASGSAGYNVTAMAGGWCLRWLLSSRRLVRDSERHISAEL